MTFALCVLAYLLIPGALAALVSFLLDEEWT